MTTPKLSVIVPCYNSASTIGRCLSSITAMNRDDVEVIVVDDASTDGSADIASRYATVVRNETNRGLAATRGRGISLARGIYITTVDSDDYVNPEALSRAIDRVVAEGADVLVSPFTTVTDGKTVTVCPKGLPDLNATPIHYTNFSLCNKLMRRSLLADNGLLPYPGLNRWEDLGVTCRLFALKPSTVITDEPWYNYIIETSRATLSRFAREATIHDRVEIARKTDEWFTARGIDGEYRPFLDLLKFYAKANYMRGRGKDVRSWLRTFPEINGRIMSITLAPLHYRLLFKALTVFNWL